MDQRRDPYHHDPSSGLTYLQLFPGIFDADAPTLILIHGAACNAETYIPFIVGLCAADKVPFRQFIAPDLPGHGKTPASVLSSPSTPRYAQLIVSLISSLQLDNIVICGHSMGCRVAACCAAFILGFPSFESAFEPIPSPPLSSSLSSQSLPPQISGLILLDGSSYPLRPTTAFSPSDSGFLGPPPSTNDDLGLQPLKAMFSLSTPPEFAEKTLQVMRSQDPVYSAKMRKEHAGFDTSGGLEAVTRFVARKGGMGIKWLVVQSTQADKKAQRRMFMSVEEGERNEFVKWMRKVVDGKGEDEGQQDELGNIGGGRKEERCTVKIVTEAGHFPHMDKGMEVIEEVVRWMQEEVRVGKDG